MSWNGACGVGVKIPKARSPVGYCGLKQKLQRRGEFDVQVVNDDLEVALKGLESILDL